MSEEIVFVQGKFFHRVFCQIEGKRRIPVKADGDFIHLRVDGGDIIGVRVRAKNVFSHRSPAEDGFALEPRSIIGNAEHIEQRGNNVHMRRRELDDLRWNEPGLPEKHGNVIHLVVAAGTVGHNPGMLFEGFTMVADKNKKGPVRHAGLHQMFVNAPELFIQQT